MTDQERIDALARELARTRDVWNYFVSALCHGQYPQRTRGYHSATLFKGRAEDRIFEIFKIMDFEVRHIAEAARAVGVDLNKVPHDFGEIFDEISRATGITEQSHKSS